MSEEYKTNEYNIETLTCPACGYEDAKVITHILDIPYYTDYAMINISCRDCGYRTSDFMNLSQKDPIRLEYRVEDESDGTTKVVRAATGIVGIPELGMQIEPNGDGATWIRNIEGILDDFKQKLVVSLRYSETNEEKRAIKKRMKLLNRLMEFERPFTIFVEDPSGNSLILPADESKLIQKELKVDVEES